MRPGQLILNELERAILQHLAPQLPELTSVIPKLHVLSREFTDVGSFTHFCCDEVIDGASTPIVLLEPINIPGIKSGLGAALFFEDGKVRVLEFFAFGDETWDGLFDGFSIG